MSKPLIVSIPHRLGQDEALRRLQTGLRDVEQKFGQFLHVDEQTWTGNRLQFRVSALAQTLSGTIDVLKKYVGVSGPLTTSQLYTNEFVPAGAAYVPPQG